MFIRPAHRHANRQLSQSLIASFEQLQLPWLCPAVNAYNDKIKRISNVAIAAKPRRSRGQWRNLSPDRQPRSRQLATASDTTQYRLSNDIPFEGLYPGEPPWRGPELVTAQSKLGPWESLATIKPHSNSNLLILKHDAIKVAPQFKRSPYSGITGSVADLQQNLYACVSVNRLDRAATLVRSLAKTFQPEAPELQDAHHQYLLGNLNSLLLLPEMGRFMAMQKWFELEVRGKGVAINGPILSIMVKASLGVLSGSRLDRTVRRYLHIAQQLDTSVREDVLASDIYTDTEWAKIVRLCPQTHSPPQDELHDASNYNDQTSTAEDIHFPPRTSTDTHGISDTTDASMITLRSVEQKGLGLKSLKQSLSSMSSLTDSQNSGEELEADLTRLQESMEEDVLSSALDRWRQENEATQEARARGKISNPQLGSYVHEWVSAMVPLLEEQIKLSEAAEQHQARGDDFERLLLGPLLKLASPESLCAAAVISFINVITTTRTPGGYNKTTLQVVNGIGKMISHEISAAQQKMRSLAKVSGLPSVERRRKLAKLAKFRWLPYSSKEFFDQAAVAKADEVDSKTLNMSVDLQIKIGAMFLSFFMKVAKIPVSTTDPHTGETITQIQPVATHAWRWRLGKHVGLINTNLELIKKLEKEPIASFLAKYLPMVVNPKPWKDADQGPYLRSKVSAIRYKDRSQSQFKYIKMAVQRGDMDQTFAGLDVIGKVPWRVNKPVFKVLTEVWNSGEAIGGLAPANPVPNYPIEPDPPNGPAHYRWKQLLKYVENEITGYHSQRCYQNFQLEVARHYLDRTFYCPHSLDFRGRAYPIPPYFNHMGADHVRGLFLFADGKPLGDNGLRWLKIHLANIYGFDKESLPDREAFTMDHLSDIYDSAEHPLDGRRWWLTCEDPWQCLAACIELRNALDSPVPSEYVSHLPVQQDGTCNGLQHYAALGGDDIGARQVNLMPHDRPADIYSAVANLVKEEVARDAARGVRQAQVLDGNITRKVVKQPVMTNVYGVTFHGAQAQVRKQLVDILPKATLDNDIHLGILSRYVVIRIFKALSSMFIGAQAIQQWLGECGARISQLVTPEQVRRLQQRRDGILEDGLKTKKQQLKTQVEDAMEEDYRFLSTVVWTTPLGMPVVQPYREASTKHIRTNIQDISLKNPKLSDPVSLRKQLQAFPPNFIHSLDATHMLLSALKCDELGLTFAAVHDSFWTHAGDVDVMSRVLRDAFVRMHSEDIIGRLKEEFETRYKGCLHFASVKEHSDVGREILKLRKEKGRRKAAFRKPGMNSKDSLDELLEEYERTQLLNSDDPDKQRQGRNMVTPASLFEADSQRHEAFISEGVAVRLLGDEELKNDVSWSVVDELPEGVDEVPDSGEYDHEEMYSHVNTTHFEDVDIDESLTCEAQNFDALGEDAGTAKDKQSRKKSRLRKVFLWLPITFPETPKKGSFDVNNLKDSVYFFS